MDGIIVISYYNALIGDGMERSEAIVRACEVQMRPVVMTCVAACVGLLPAAVSTMQGMVGFGMALVAAPLLALIDPALVPIPLLVVTTGHSVLTVGREHGATDWPGVGWAISDDKVKAEERAQKNCEVTAGPGRRDFCKVNQSACDTHN